MLCERHENRCCVGVGAAPFAGLAPDRIYSADAARQRVDDVEITNHLLLVRNRDTESGDGSFLRQREKIPELQWRDQKGQVNGINAACLESAIMDGWRNRVADRVGDHAIDLRQLGNLLDAI